MLKILNIQVMLLMLFMQNFVKLAPLIKPCIVLGVILFLVYDG
jgi:hypothetical protein